MKYRAMKATAKETNAGRGKCDVAYLKDECGLIVGRICGSSADYVEEEARLFAAAPLLLATLEHMVELFDHNGLYGLIAGAKRHGWTEKDLSDRMAACIAARSILASVGTAPTRVAA